MADAFRRVGVQTVLVGGHALNHHGVTRQTADVDLMVVLSDREGAVSALSGIGFRESTSSELFVRCQHLDPTVMDVDLLFVDPETFDKVVGDGIRIRIEERDYMVPSLDTLIAMKLHALRHASGRMLKDGGDIVALLVGSGRHPDDIRSLCAMYGSPEIMKQVQFLYECETSA